MKKTTAFVSIALWAFSITASAHQKTCFGTAENKGNKLILDISKTQVKVLATDSLKLDISKGSRIDHLQGRIFPFTKNLNGTYRYNVGFEFGGNTLLLIEKDLAENNISSGSATIRSVGDNGPLYINFFCK